MNTSLGVVSFATAVIFLRLILRSSRYKTRSRSIASPRDSLIPFLSSHQASTLPYPPNFFPGARDVDSPYGKMRVYEWGPLDGRKVAMVHGDTTPAPLFEPIAKALVEKGCRVLILDLWGRGYSDSPLGLSRSSSGGFTIVGFSLGGSIAMSFATYYPHLLNSIILLGPGGLIRSLPDGYDSVFLRCSSMVPSRYLRRLVGNILGATLTTAPQHRPPIDALPMVAQESSAIPKKKDHNTVDVSAIVQWQFDNHEGFVYSFINTSQHGPLQNQQSEWANICNVIKGESPAHTLSKIYNSKIFVVFGDFDGIVVGDEVLEDLSQILGGREHIVCKTVPGGHGFPVPSSEQVIEHISDFLKL